MGTMMATRQARRSSIPTPDGSRASLTVFFEPRSSHYPQADHSMLDKHEPEDKSLAKRRRNSVQGSLGVGAGAVGELVRGVTGGVSAGISNLSQPLSNLSMKRKPGERKVEYDLEAGSGEGELRSNSRSRSRDRRNRPSREGSGEREGSRSRARGKPSMRRASTSLGESSTGPLEESGALGVARRPQGGTAGAVLARRQQAASAEV